MAAELGKALLERNEELQRKNEEILQEASAKVEMVEQEKYVMNQNFALKERLVEIKHFSQIRLDDIENTTIR